VREADLAPIAPAVLEQALPQPGSLARRGERLLAKVSASPDIAALAHLAVTLVRAAKAAAPA
jgi:hypothetical protein